MCPDRQLLSVYLDGEMPSPWKEKMESHLAQCGGCREQLENYRRLFAQPEEALLHEKAAMEAAKDRVWQNLQSRRRVGRRSRVFAVASVLRRKVSIPLPAAAAAAVIIFLAAFWIRGGSTSGSATKPAELAVIPNTILASEDMPNIIIPASSDMKGALQYLGGFDSGDIIILRLPESRNFLNFSEPAIINAADYTGRRP